MSLQIVFSFKSNGTMLTRKLGVIVSFLVSYQGVFILIAQRAPTTLQRSGWIMQGHVGEERFFTSEGKVTIVTPMFSLKSCSVRP